MKNLTKFKCVVLAVIFLFASISVYAQDSIVLKDGTMIEAKVTEISPTEIRYKRLDNLDGPTIVIPAAKVLSIKYENGIVEVINTEPPAKQKAASKPVFAEIDPNKLYFGVAADPSGFLLSGPAISTEFTKGWLYAQLDMRLPFLGMIPGTEDFGMAVCFNYMWHFKYGNLYLGAMAEMAFGKYYIENYYVDALGKKVDESKYESGLGYVGFAVNAGYKLIFASGLYIRAGAYVGVSIPLLEETSFLFRPGLSFGYDFK